MSTLLALIPFSPSADHSHTLLGPIECTVDFDNAVTAIQDKHGRDVPLTLNTYFSDEWEAGVRKHYGNTQVDDYDNPLKHVAVHELRPLEYMDATQDSWLATSALAYIYALPDGWRVALYWH
jgi:hypothetical protein